MPPINLPVVFGSVLAGAVIIDYGVKHTRTALASTGAASPGAGTSTATGSLPGFSAGSGGYVSPLPGVTRWGRTDQGVDADATPGSPVRSLGDAKVIGILQNWYSGQPYVWTQLLSGPLAGDYVYYAEQVTPSVSPGDVVSAGGQIGTVASSGTGLELGLATASGETQAMATTGYQEGDVTPAGQRFREILSQIVGHTI